MLGESNWDLYFALVFPFSITNHITLSRQANLTSKDLMMPSTGSVQLLVLLISLDHIGGHYYHASSRRWPGPTQTLDRQGNRLGRYRGGHHNTNIEWKKNIIGAKYDLVKKIIRPKFELKRNLLNAKLKFKQDLFNAKRRVFKPIVDLKKKKINFLKNILQHKLNFLSTIFG